VLKNKTTSTEDVTILKSTIANQQAQIDALKKAIELLQKR
jgi:hypothetical protein